MAEEYFENDFVVKVESGHPGYVAYSIIATPMAWRKLVSEVSVALENPRSSKHQQKENGEFGLISKNATISRGRTSRVSISFLAAED
jgi:hypothetical protein